MKKICLINTHAVNNLIEDNFGNPKSFHINNNTMRDVTHKSSHLIKNRWSHETSKYIEKAIDGSCSSNQIKRHSSEFSNDTDNNPKFQSLIYNENKMKNTSKCENITKESSLVVNSDYALKNYEGHKESTSSLDSSQEESLRHVINTIDENEQEIQRLYKKVFEANEILSEKIKREQMLKTLITQCTMAVRTLWNENSENKEYINTDVSFGEKLNYITDISNLDASLDSIDLEAYDSLYC